MYGDLKTAMNTELTTLTTEPHPEDVETLKQEVKWMGALTDSLHCKCEDLQSRSRRNDIRIVGVPEGPNSCSSDSVADLLQISIHLRYLEMTFVLFLVLSK